MTQVPGNEPYLLRHTEACPYKRPIEIHDLCAPLKFWA